MEEAGEWALKKYCGRPFGSIATGGREPNTAMSAMPESGSKPAVPCRLVVLAATYRTVTRCRSEKLRLGVFSPLRVVERLNCTTDRALGGDMRDE